MSGEGECLGETDMEALQEVKKDRRETETKDMDLLRGVHKENYLDDENKRSVKQKMHQGERCRYC